MVLLHIITADKEQAKEIANYLVKERLVVTTVATERVVSTMRAIDGAIVEEEQTLIIGKTKALLFKEVDDRLRKMYEKNMPVLYSLPIVNMDWEQVDFLVKETATV